LIFANTLKVLKLRKSTLNEATKINEQVKKHQNMLLVGIVGLVAAGVVFTIGAAPKTSIKPLFLGIEPVISVWLFYVVCYIVIFSFLLMNIAVILNFPLKPEAGRIVHEYHTTPYATDLNELV